MSCLDLEGLGGRFPGYNVEIAKKLGSIAAAIVLSDIAREENWRLRERLATSHPKYGSGLIPLDPKQIEERTYVPVRQINKFIRQFKASGFLEVYLFGMPSRRYFRLVGVPS